MMRLMSHTTLVIDIGFVLSRHSRCGCHDGGGEIWLSVRITSWIWAACALFPGLRGSDCGCQLFQLWSHVGQISAQNGTFDVSAVRQRVHQGW